MSSTSYSAVVDFLYNQLPVFQHQGPSAYKPGLETTRNLAAAFGNPQHELRYVHVAGTNGKGSTAHTIAAVLQSAGYKVGLFTSPHLIDFRERIKVDGAMIPEDAVVDFIERYRVMNLSFEPTFFELTTIMALDYFRSQNVDVAVMEVGLGGRLDSTNIIVPDLSIITNISFDHTALLGNTLEAIAGEKAGIIKHGVPVVIGEADGGVKDVFVDKANAQMAPIVFAQESDVMERAMRVDGGWRYHTADFGVIDGELGGDCQRLNAVTILASLRQLVSLGYKITGDAVKLGFGHVYELTGLMGRWMKIGDAPETVCDTGHNPGGWQYISAQLSVIAKPKRLVIGFVGDKDVSSILDMMSRIPQATYYFTSPGIRRAMSVDALAGEAAKHGLTGKIFKSVGEAYEKALADSDKGDMVFVGGSSFVVADLLSYLKR